jgi:hypothetical protein
MKKHIKHLVLVENTSFCFRNFLDFEIDGKHYSMTHGTFRNKISKLVREGFVELQFRSGPAFYSLPGHNFTKRKIMTGDHAVVTSMSSLSPVSFIDNLPFNKHALHNIRLKFVVEGIWSTTISANHLLLRTNDKSKDIALDPIETSGLTVRVTVHHTDTVSVMVACSLNPVAVDIKGLVRLSNALTRVEERLLRLVDKGPLSLSLSSPSPIPDHSSWIITMWHFGKDSLDEYTGKEFEMTWKDAENALIRIYTKDLKDGKGIRIRTERQEYPDKSFDEAMDEKLSVVGANVTKAINQNDDLRGGHSFFNQITKYACNYCVYDTINVQEYESHVVRKHPGKMCYPGKVDLERLAVEGQGSPGRNK